MTRLRIKGDHICYVYHALIIIHQNRIPNIHRQDITNLKHTHTQALAHVYLYSERLPLNPQSLTDIHLLKLYTLI